MVQTTRGRERERTDPVLELAGKTAIKRGKPSLPAKMLVKMLLPEESVFDWGCGKGEDVEYLRNEGFYCKGWDPVHKPDTVGTWFYPFDWVLCSYVINVLPPEQRAVILPRIHAFLPEDGSVLVATRASKEVNRQVKDTWTASYDGWTTSKGTFQRGFTPRQVEHMLLDAGFVRVIRHKNDPVVLSAYKTIKGGRYARIYNMGIK